MSADQGPASRRTRTVVVDPERPDPGSIREAARCLQRGGLVVFPTETVYGLGADATDGQAVAAIFAAKGRPQDNPVIVHVSSPAEVAPLVRGEPDPRATALMRAFWPGPLSLIFPRSARVAAEVSCGLDTVAIRMPRHPVALELVRQAGVPIAAPSANVSGRPSPTRAGDVAADLDGKVDYILDAGPCPVGLESTVLDLSGPVPTVLRPGGVTVEQLRREIGEVRVLAGGREPGGEAAARSPGLRHRHYSPRARLTLVLPPGAGDAGIAQAVASVIARESAAGRAVGVACTRETAEALARRDASQDPPGTGGSPARIEVWGERGAPEKVAASLFAVLRDLDNLGVDVIVAEGMPPEGLGVAINDRLGRAAASVVEAGAPLAAPELILLVCSGNTCRSPMGSVILGDLLDRRGLGARYRVDSAGTSAAIGQPASPEARQVASERGLDLRGHLSKPVTPELLRSARLILAMTRQHKDALLRLYPAAADRTYTLKGFGPPGPASGPAEGEDISDPIDQGLEAYRRAAEDIERASGAVVERLQHPPDIDELLGRS